MRYALYPLANRALAHLAIAERLLPVVAMDYERRKAGLKPDQMHWADDLLLNLGWAVARQTMTDEQKIAELREALKIAMAQWAGWVEDARGCHPREVMGDEDDWAKCESVLDKSDT